MPQTPHGPLRSFGRIRSRAIKPRQEALLESLLPHIAVPDPEAHGIDPATLMPGAAETWLEIGFGGGEHLAAQAARRPDVLLLGAEPFMNGMASALRHIEAGGIGNVRLHMGDARALIGALPDNCLSRVFILFPDPWPKARHRKRRLVQPAFVADLARVVRPRGRVRFATDWEDYADTALRAFLGAPQFRWTAGRADDWRTPPADHVETRYEAKRLGDCAPLFFDFERVQ